MTDQADIQNLREMNAALEERLENALYELNEAKAEISRHHMDFAAISEMCRILDNPSGPLAITRPEFYTAIKSIRNIVG